MPRPYFTDEQVLDGLLQFARTHLVAGGSLRVKHYQEWRDRPVSFSLITSRFGENSWTTTLFRFRDEMAAQAADPAVLVGELPVPCRCDVGLSWMTGTVAEWPNLVCDCEACAGPTIGAGYRDLVSRLVTAEDAERPATELVWWACPRRHPNHRPFKARAAKVAAGETYCGGCQSLATFYASRPPGSLFHNPKGARSKLEQATVAAMRELLPVERFATQQSIAMPVEWEPLTGRGITPDVLMVRRRIVIEIDGGTGKSGSRSRHDTPKGVLDDTNRDRAFNAQCWTTIRLRHPNALPLPGSPAIIVTTTSRTPRIMAELLADQIRAVLQAVQANSGLEM